jgi:hypothetical protein
VAINSSGAEPDPSAMLDISAADKGILIPLFCARRERSQKALLIFSELRK